MISKAKALEFDDYATGFNTARSIRRYHHFYLGPTNSGKTHAAIEALKQANSGVYLAPLRLLAMEIRDRLMAAGVPCSLITGEEREIVPGARHTASTIEMMHPKNIIDVAVIDEIQMLQDPDRGSAWTAALVGVPAKQIYICGSNAVTSACLKVLDHLNEPYEITLLDRKTPLVLEESTLCGKKYSRPKLKKQIQTGDTIIAFSRKDVLTYAVQFRHWGFRVATIYGALSPEVRRTEAERFASGTAQILVATDAIGMGLNLPIRRIIFASAHKFDGIASRLLNATEVRQIAGRAGRFGIYPTGYVNVMEDEEHLHIAHMLATDDRITLDKLPISHSLAQIQLIADRLFTNRIAECFEYLTHKNQPHSSLFSLASSPLCYIQAQLVDQHAPNMSLPDKYIFCMAPVSLSLNIEKDYFLQCLLSVYQNKKRGLPATPAWLNAENSTHLEEAEQLSLNLSLYAWLSFKYPKIFVASNEVKSMRQTISRYIEQALITQKGYGKTQKENDYR